MIEKVCGCGCGKEVPPNYRGVRKQFLRGHYPRKRKSPSDRKAHMCNGYRMVCAPDHPKANKDGYIGEHILVAEKALGRYLPDGAEVHHWNCVRSDNRPENLLICPDAAYHQLIHKRMRAHDESGDAGNLKCYICGKWDAPQNLYVHPRQVAHRECHRQYQAKRKAA